MNGIKSAVLDSNILIYCSKNRLSIRDLAARYDRFYVSSIVWMETLGFPFENEAEKIKIEAMLRAFECVHTDMEIVEQVIFYKQTRRIKTPDAIILATARRLGADLVTVNEADFRTVDPSVFVFCPTLTH